MKKLIFLDEMIAFKLELSQCNYTLVLCAQGIGLNLESN